jgi:hypothetical protein
MNKNTQAIRYNFKNKLTEIGDQNDETILFVFTTAPSQVDFGADVCNRECCTNSAARTRVGSRREPLHHAGWNRPERALRDL